MTSTGSFWPRCPARTGGSAPPPRARWGRAATAPHCRPCTPAIEDSDTYVQQSAILALDKVAERSSFPYLFKALENAAILDDVSEVFVRHKELYSDLLEEAWRTADSRREVVIAAILAAMKKKDEG